MVEKSRRDVMKFSGALLGGIAVGSTVTAAENTDRFIVSANGTSASELADVGVTVDYDLSDAGLFVVSGAESDLQRVANSYEPDVQISLDGDVERLAADPSSVADETYSGLQWDKSVQNIEGAHERTKGEGTRVAIIDSGVASGHPDLDVNERLSFNFTGDGFGAANPAGGDHGTHVGGIVGASDNGQGVIGTAPETELVDCRVFSEAGGASFGDILAGVVYSAAIGADAANLSLGAYPVPRQAIGEFYGKVLNKVMTYANSHGTVLTIAAGNDAADLQHDKNFISLPNEGAQAVSVSATGPIGYYWDADGNGDIKDVESPPDSPAFYTNYGTNAITLSAPGGDADLDAIGTGVDWSNDLVLSTVASPEYRYEDGDSEKEPLEYLGASYSYGWKAGTSMAAPQVAGAVALLRSVASDLNANQVESLLKRTAASGTGDKTYHGSGFLNVTGALDELQ
jgi:subtilisin family serine protease